MVGEAMRVLVDVGHPGDVHFFKNIIWGLERDGHKVGIVLRDKDVAKYLLDIYGFDYEILVEQHYKGLLKKMLGMMHIICKFYNVARKANTDIIMAEGPTYIVPVSKLLKKTSISFTINESEYGAHLENILLPFADIICTSTSFEGEVNTRKNILYNSYFYLAYLHPNYFKPDDSIFEMLSINRTEKFFILRFKRYDAAHDIGKRGFSFDKLNFIKKLEKYGKVFISSRDDLQGELKKYKLELPPEKFHDAIYFANMYIGDGFSTAAEAAILGTPAILVSTIWRGYINELRDKYGLVCTCKTDVEALRIVSQLQGDVNLKEKWRMKKEKMLGEKIDVTAFIVNLIENYPNILKNKKIENGTP